MRRLILVALAALPLGGCFSFSSSQPAPIVVVPPGSRVICPNGSQATYDAAAGVYRC
jgi:hypothetical protein